MKSSYFWIIAAMVCVFGLLFISCSSGDDDDDNDSSSDDVGTDDDSGDCTQETICEWSVACGYSDSVDECMSLWSQFQDECSDPTALLTCECNCGVQATDCQAGYDCGTECFNTSCQ
jgi:hypothetical protein